MKAILIDSYGEGDNLVYADIPIPVPKKKEVLVKVLYTTVNDYEWCIMRGKPKLYRLLFGIWKPKLKLGMELSGVVESTGPDASNFALGDEVLGDISQYGSGSFAEYICIDERALRKKPREISFKDAACLPHAGLLAYQAIQLHGEIEKGMEILVNGAGGGFGCFTVQLLKLNEAIITGVDSGEKLELMRQLGCDAVLDYKQQDFTRLGKKYDLILDPKTNRFPWQYFRALKKGGQYITVGGSPSKLLLGGLMNFLLGPFTGKKYRILFLEANKGLEKILHHYRVDAIRPFIHGPLPLEKAAEAIQCFGQGKHKGKIVIHVYNEV